MPSWHDRFVTKARTDGELRQQLHELARLDSMAMAGAGQALTASWSELAQRVDTLCDQVAQRVVEPGEEADEAAQWISYHCQEVARALPASSSSIGMLIPLLFAVVVAVLVYRWYQNWILAALGGLAAMSLASWVRSMRQG